MDPDLYEVYNHACRPAPLPGFLVVVSVLIAKGSLREAGDPLTA